MRSIAINLLQNCHFDLAKLLAVTLSDILGDSRLSFIWSVSGAEGLPSFPDQNNRRTLKGLSRMHGGGLGVHAESGSSNFICSIA